MSLSENQRETLEWVIRLHWMLVGILFVLVFVTEGVGPPGAISGYDLVFSASVFFLIIYFLFLLHRGEKYLATIIFLMDGLAFAVAVALSGGPVSYYLPTFFISLVGACLVCSPEPPPL